MAFSAHFRPARHTKLHRIVWPNAKTVSVGANAPQKLQNHALTMAHAQICAALSALGVLPRAQFWAKNAAAIFAHPVTAAPIKLIPCSPKGPGSPNGSTLTTTLPLCCARGLLPCRKSGLRQRRSGHPACGNAKKDHRIPPNVGPWVSNPGPTSRGPSAHTSRPDCQSIQRLLVLNYLIRI